MTAAFYGWDIGGAHLKLACLDHQGRLLAVYQQPCPLWQGLAQLPQAAAALGLHALSSPAVHAITMTGELCDVFTDRAQGVRAILECLHGMLGDAASMRVYAGIERWLSPTDAIAAASQVASANWLALADLVARRGAHGLLLDIGSTTTDVILIEQGEVRSEGRDDGSRLVSGELIYTGVVRTAVMAVARQVPVHGQWQTLCAEYFATMSDVYRVLEELDERHDQMATADGRGKDCESSARRIARMLGRDFGTDVSLTDLRGVAHHLARVQAREIEDAVALQASRARAADGRLPIIGAGAGAFVAARIALAQGRDFVPFQSLLEPELDADLAAQAALAAPAVAVAKLAWQMR